MKAEVAERWGEQELKAVEERIQKLGKDGWEDHKQKGEEINKLLADLMSLSPSDVWVQKAIALHHENLNFYYKVTKERYLGLAQMYVDDERFFNHYEKYGKNLAAFIHGAVKVYCENGMHMVE